MCKRDKKQVTQTYGRYVTTLFDRACMYMNISFINMCKLKRTENEERNERERERERERGGGWWWCVCCVLIIITYNDVVQLIFYRWTCYILIGMVWCVVFNATFNNSSDISWG